MNQYNSENNIDFLLNASPDWETYGNGGDEDRNDSFREAQDLDELFRPLPGEGGEWVTVVGRGDPVGAEGSAEPDDAISTANSSESRPDANAPPCGVE